MVKLDDTTEKKIKQNALFVKNIDSYAVKCIVRKIKEDDITAFSILEFFNIEDIKQSLFKNEFIIFVSKDSFFDIYNKSSISIVLQHIEKFKVQWDINALNCKAETRQEVLSQVFNCPEFKKLSENYIGARY